MTYDSGIRLPTTITHVHTDIYTILLYNYNTAPDISHFRVEFSNPKCLRAQLKLNKDGVIKHKYKL